MQRTAPTLLHDHNVRDQARRALGRIAATLGCPADVLMRAARSPTFPDETAELVRLWIQITDPAAQRRVLTKVGQITGG